jgi:hypothetical protein
MVIVKLLFKFSKLEEKSSLMGAHFIYVLIRKIFIKSMYRYSLNSPAEHLQRVKQFQVVDSF